MRRRPVVEAENPFVHCVGRADVCQAVVDCHGDRGRTVAVAEAGQGIQAHLTDKEWLCRIAHVRDNQTSIGCGKQAQISIDRSILNRSRCPERWG